MCLAVPGRILDIDAPGDPLERTARVSFGGAVRRVHLAYVPAARVGDHVVVHVGFALSIVDPDEARRALEHFRDIAALEAAGDEPR